MQYDEIAVHKSEMAKIKEEFKTRQAHRLSEIAAEAQQKENEANQQARNAQIKEENQSGEEGKSCKHGHIL